MERVVLEWAADLFGFDKDRFGGCLLSGGSMSNFTALATARDAAGLRWGFRAQLQPAIPGVRITDIRLKRTLNLGPFMSFLLISEIGSN